MKRTELIRYLREQGCELLREGARHSVWVNPTEKRVSTIPRHGEVVDQLTRKISKDLGVPWIIEPS